MWPRTWTTLERVGLVVALSVIAIAWYRPSARLLVTGSVVLVLLIVAGWRLHRNGNRVADRNRVAHQRKSSVQIGEAANSPPEPTRSRRHFRQRK